MIGETEKWVSPVERAILGSNVIPQVIEEIYFEEETPRAPIATKRPKVEVKRRERRPRGICRHFSREGKYVTIPFVYKGTILMVQGKERQLDGPIPDKIWSLGKPKLGPREEEDGEAINRGVKLREMMDLKGPEMLTPPFHPETRVLRKRTVDVSLKRFKENFDPRDDYERNERRDCALNAVNYAHAMWSIKKDPVATFNEMITLNRDQQQELVDRRGYAALKHILSGNCHPNEYERSYAIYSARRITRAPQPLKSCFPKLAKLFKKPPHFPEYQLKSWDLYFRHAIEDVTPHIYWWPRAHESYKACIEQDKASGGQNWVSSELVRYFDTKRGFENNKDEIFEIKERDPKPTRRNTVRIGCVPDQMPPHIEGLLEEYRMNEDKHIELLDFALTIIEGENFVPVMYVLDLPERGNKHRIPCIPEWCMAYVGGVISQILAPTLDKINRSTFRGDKATLTAKANYYYAGDVKGGTDNFYWEPMRILWKIILERVEMPGWAEGYRARFKKIMNKLIGPHILFEDSEQLKKWRALIQGDEYKWSPPKKKIGIDLYFDRNVGRAPLRVYEGGTSFGKQILTHKVGTHQLLTPERYLSIRKLMLPDGPITTNGCQMCYRWSFSTLSWMMFICHYQLVRTASFERENPKKREDITFWNVGDDNASGHTKLESIQELKKSQAAIGAEEHPVKSQVSEHGYIIAETIKVWDQKGVVHSLNQPKLKALWPEQDGNTWLSQPQAVYKLYKGCDYLFQARAQRIVWEHHYRKYLRLVKAGIDIFDHSPEPLFPLRYYDGNNKLGDAFSRDMKEVKRLYLPPVPKQRGGALVEYYTKKDLDNICEKPTHFYPMFDLAESYAPVKEMTLDAFNQLTMEFRQTPGFISGRPPPCPRTLTPDMIIKRWMLLRPGSRDSDWIYYLTEQHVNICTSLFGLMRGQRWLPYNQRWSLRDKPLDTSKWTLFVDDFNLFFGKHYPYEQKILAIHEYMKKKKPGKFKQIILVTDYYIRERWFRKDDTDLMVVKPYAKGRFSSIPNADDTIIELQKGFRKNGFLWSYDEELRKAFRHNRGVTLSTEDFGTDDEDFPDMHEEEYISAPEPFDPDYINEDGEEDEWFPRLQEHERFLVERRGIPRRVATGEMTVGASLPDVIKTPAQRKKEAERRRLARKRAEQMASLPPPPPKRSSILRLSEDAEAESIAFIISNEGYLPQWWGNLPVKTQVSVRTQMDTYYETSALPYWKYQMVEIEAPPMRITATKAARIAEAMKTPEGKLLPGNPWGGGRTKESKIKESKSYQPPTQEPIQPPPIPLKEREEIPQTRASKRYQAEREPAPVPLEEREEIPQTRASRRHQGDKAKPGKPGGVRRR